MILILLKLIMGLFLFFFIGWGEYELLKMLNLKYELNLDLLVYDKIILLVNSLIALLIIWKFKRGGKNKNLKNWKKHLHKLANTKKNKAITVGHESILNPLLHTLIAGSSGSGKSYSIIEPILEQLISLDYTGLVYDYKTPILEKYLRNCRELAPKSKDEVPIYNLNMARPEYTDRFDVLESITNQLTAREIATTLILTNAANKSQDDFFNKAAISYLTASFYYFKLAYKGEKFKITLPHIFAFLTLNKTEDIINFLCEDLITKQILKPVIDSAESDKQLAGITATVSNLISLFIDEGIFFALSGENDFYLNGRKDRKNSEKLLVLANSPEVENALNPLISLVSKCCMSSINSIERTRISAFIIDELDTLYIFGLNKFLSTVRSNYCGCFLAFQDISQLINTYNPNIAQTIIANCSYQFYGKTNNPTAIEHIKRLVGEYEHHYTQHSSSRSSSGLFGKTSTSTSQSAAVRNISRIRNDDILNLNAGQFFFLSPNVNLQSRARLIPSTLNIKKPKKVLDELEKKHKKEFITAEFERIIREANTILN